MCSSAVYRFWVILGVLGLGGPASGAALELTVDDDAGQPMAFRVQAFQAGRMVAQTWERGRARLELPAGKQTVLVRHGFDHDAVSMELNPGRQAIEKHVTLKKRYDVKSLGWYCGESHLHGQHGRSDKPQSFADAARLAEANGLDYIQIAQWWTPDFGWTPPEKLDAMARQASTAQVAVHWNLEFKCYFTPDDGGAGGNLHCYGHGCTLGMEDRPYDRAFWFTGPDFHILQEVHRQGAVVTLAHPARFWFNQGNFVSNWASEIAFNYVAGQGYDGVDIFNDGEPVFFQHERVWWNLLNMGYKVAGTAGSDGSIIGGHAGRFRTYTHIDGDFSWAKIAPRNPRGRVRGQLRPYGAVRGGQAMAGGGVPSRRPAASRPPYGLVQSLARRNAGLGAGASQRRDRSGLGPAQQAGEAVERGVRAERHGLRLVCDPRDVHLPGPRLPGSLAAAGGDLRGGRGQPGLFPAEGVSSSAARGGQSPPQDHRSTRQALGGDRPRGRRGTGGCPGEGRFRRRGQLPDARNGRAFDPGPRASRK